ncbi:MAG: LPP20 family lipoprotein [Candidatus Sumerlaeia bacterium]|nr:LPP20 family lipoprotein [Candidatus Sumerlaeia bacterium]
MCKHRVLKSAELFVFSLLFFVLTVSFAQDSPKTVATEAQAKAMARRAAIADGYRQLAEIVNGIQLDSRTTVRNFITENDEINSRVKAVIRGARIVDTEYLEDGTCKVRMELRIRDLHKALRRSFSYPSDRIRVIGVGVPNPVEEPSPTPAPTPEEEEWEDLIISATGKGVPPADITDPAQRRIMAERAAYLDAVRLLGENIKGVYINSNTTVKDFVTQNDEIRAKFEGWIKGAKKTMVRELPDGTVEVDVEMPLSGLRNIIRPTATSTPCETSE